MKPALLFALALTSGALAGGATALYIGTPRTEAPAPSPVEPVSPGPESALLALMDVLAQENRALQERIADLERRPLPSPRLPVDGLVSREDFDALREELLAALTALATGAAAAPDPLVFEERVAEALTSIRKDEAAERIRAFQEQRAERFEDDLTRAQERLGLNPYQVGELRAAMIARYDREEEVRRAWERDGSDPAVGELKRESAQAWQADLQRFLTPVQLQTLSKGSDRDK